MSRLVAFFLLILPFSTLAADLQIGSNDIKMGQKLDERFVFKGFGCDGQNISPSLFWENAPEGTKSFAITSYDPDAPTGSGWWHWLVYNIPADVNHFETGMSSDIWRVSSNIIQGRNDFGAFKYGGACPPKGDQPHRYIFTIYALDVDRLDVPKDASPALIGYMINANLISKSSLTAFYWR